MEPSPAPVPDDLLARFEERKARYVRGELTDEERAAYWERMPEAFREETLRLRDERMKLEADQTRLVRKYRWKYALSGLIVAVFLARTGAKWSTGYLALFAAVETAAAFVIAARRLDHLRAVALYGGGGLAIWMLGALCGWVHWGSYGGFGGAGALIVFFSCCIALVVTGGLIGLLAEFEHQRRFSPY